MAEQKRDYGAATYRWRLRHIKWIATFPRPHWDRSDPLFLRWRFWATHPVIRAVKGAR